MISIIIVNYSVENYLKKCIESILKYIGEIDFEIIVIDNNSTDRSVNMLRDNFKQIKLIKNKINLGFAKAVNLGLKKSKGRYVALVNPDAYFIENSFSICRVFLEENSNIGVIGCKVMNEDGTLQLSSRRNFPYIYSYCFKMLGISKIFPKNKIFSNYNQTYIDEDIIQETQSISGAFMMFEKKIIDKIGYFDERFFLYFEDTDFCFRAIKAGYKVIYYPLTKFFHYKSMSSKINNLNMKNYFDDSFLLFFEKYKEYYYYNFLTKIGLKLVVFFRKKNRSIIQK